MKNGAAKDSRDGRRGIDHPGRGTRLADGSAPQICHVANSPF